MVLTQHIGGRAATHTLLPRWVLAVRKRNPIWSSCRAEDRFLCFFALRMTTGPKIPGTVIPRRVFTQPGSIATHSRCPRNVRFAPNFGHIAATRPTTQGAIFGLMRCNKVGGHRNSFSGIQLVEQRLGLLQVERVEAFGEPAIDRSEKIAGLMLAPLFDRGDRLLEQLQPLQATQQLRPSLGRDRLTQDRAARFPRPPASSGNPSPPRFERAIEAVKPSSPGYWPAWRLRSTGTADPSVNRERPLWPSAPS